MSVVHVQKQHYGAPTRELLFPETDTHQTILMVAINHHGWDDEEIRKLVDLELMYIVAQDTEFEDWKTVIV